MIRHAYNFCAKNRPIITTNFAINFFHNEFHIYLVFYITQNYFLYRLEASLFHYHIVVFQRYYCNSTNPNSFRYNFQKINLATASSNRLSNQTFLFSTSTHSLTASPSGTGSTNGTQPPLKEELLDEDELLDEELAASAEPSPSAGSANDAKAAAAPTEAATAEADHKKDENEEELEDTFDEEVLAEEELLPEEVTSAIATTSPTAEPQAMTAANLLSGLLDRPPPRAEKRSVIPFGYFCLMYPNYKI